jgi:hypothetical protein
MPKQDDELPPVTPPPCLPIFPNLPSELQPPPDPSARPDKVEGTTPVPHELETLRSKNARLRDKIKEIVERHPELRDLSDEIAVEQGEHVEVGTPFLERVNGKLQERARAIIERRPDLERCGGRSGRRRSQIMVAQDGRQTG